MPCFRGHHAQKWTMLYKAEMILDRSKVLTVCRRLALAAGDAIMAVREGSGENVRQKSDMSPVTEADLAADRIISEGLRDAFPEIALVTEEQADTHNGAAPDVFFIVDPLDGTKDFVGGGADFTVNIALIEHAIPSFGIVYAPVHDRLFYTSESGDALEELAPFSEHALGKTTRLNVSEDCDGALTVVASKSHRDKATDDYIGRYTVQDFKSAGSSLKFCLVASGEAHLYPRLGRTMEWDTAAGDAVLRAAGGKMLCFEKHNTYRYGKSGYENQAFLAAAGSLALKK